MCKSGCLHFQDNSNLTTLDVFGNYTTKKDSYFPPSLSPWQPLNKMKMIQIHAVETELWNVFQDYLFLPQASLAEDLSTFVCHFQTNPTF